MLAKIKTVDFLRDVNSDLYVENPQVTIDIDREKAAFYGISVDQIRQELYDAFGTRQVGTIYSVISMISRWATPGCALSIAPSPAHQPGSVVEPGDRYDKKAFERERHQYDRGRPSTCWAR